MTFETEEGFNRAARYNDTVEMDERFHQYKTLLFQPLEIREASEPTDIIWENRFYLPIERFYKKCIVFFVIIVMLFFSFQIIFNLQKKSLAMKGRQHQMGFDLSRVVPAPEIATAITNIVATTAVVTIAEQQRR